MTSVEPENGIMDAYTVVFDGLDYLGPGDTATTRGLLERLRSSLPSKPRVADFGCGVGASTLAIARCLPEARVLALDSHTPFVARLETEARERGLGDRVEAMTGDMAAPPPLDGIEGEFDLIWAESAIYCIGRINAFTCWKTLLKTGGWLVFSDVVWQSETGSRSPEAIEFWTGEYPDITTRETVVEELKTAGYDPLEPLAAPRRAWSNYYDPLRERLDMLAKEGQRSKALDSVLAEFDRELAIYDSAGQDVTLCFFAAQPNPEFDA